MLSNLTRTHTILICVLALVQLLWHGIVQIETLDYLKNYPRAHLGQTKMNPLSILAVGADFFLFLAALLSIRTSFKHATISQQRVGLIKCFCIVSFGLAFMAPVWTRLHMDYQSTVARSFLPYFPPTVMEGLYASGFCATLILILLRDLAKEAHIHPAVRSSQTARRSQPD